MTQIEGTEIFKTERGAKVAAARRGYSEGARILTHPRGFILLALCEGFAGSQVGWDLMEESQSYKFLTPHGNWATS